jgi:hypothetical protein
MRRDLEQPSLVLPDVVCREEVNPCELAELIAGAEAVQQCAQRLADRFFVAGLTVAKNDEIEAQTSPSPPDARAHNRAVDVVRRSQFREQDGRVTGESQAPEPRLARRLAAIVSTAPQRR